MGFPTQEYWSGLPFPSPRDLPNRGIKPMSPALAGRLSTTETGGKVPLGMCYVVDYLYSITGVQGFPDSSVGKESACKEGDLGSIPGLGRSPGEGKGYPLQYSGLENPMNYIVHGIAKSQIRLSNFHFTSQVS